METKTNRDHLAEAKAVSALSDAVAGSPDARSIPFLLSGILDALIAIAENGAER